MKYKLEVEIDSDAIEASGLDAVNYIHQEMGWVADSGIRLVNLEEIEEHDSREAFYFSFGPAESFPFQEGWVEVKATSREEAYEMFASHYPRQDGMLYCSFVYDEAEWEKTPMAQGAPAQDSHQVIDNWGPYKDAKTLDHPLDDLVKEAKGRLKNRVTSNENKDKKPPEPER